ncbi:MAG TPA: hypothetical protein VKR78_05995 [Acidimicrobiales bacterium]|nr:hypothetical protein [Acidimicrobiales bacterium]
MNGQASLGRLLERWLEQRDPHATRAGVIEVVDVEVLVPGRPGVLDVVAEIDGRLAHAVLGIRRPGDELRVLGTLEEPTIGTIEDDDGVGLVTDALHDADAARLLLGVVAGTSQRAGGVQRGPAGPVVSLVRDDDEATSLAFDRRFTLTVFPWLSRGPHPGTTLLAGLDESGFNHLPAPIAFWRRAGLDLGVVQELLAGMSSGWALAISSLRDVIASGVSPDVAGGDFAPEALALGTMAARMHIALDRAFGRRVGDIAVWVDELRNDVLTSAAIDLADPGRDDIGAAGARGTGGSLASIEELLDALRASGLHPPAIRTHGDFHLGRTARTDHGWVLADCMPGGTVPGSAEPLFRCPLADVADFTWSLRHAAAVAASERGPASSPTRAGDLASAWEARNRRAFVAAYLATPGIGGLIPADRRIVRGIIRLFELARAARGRVGAASVR